MAVSRRFLMAGSSLTSGSPAVIAIGNGELMPASIAQPVSNRNIRDITFSPDGDRMLMVGANSPTVEMRSLVDFSVVTTGIDARTAYSCAWSPDGSHIAVGYLGAPHMVVYRVSDWNVVFSGGATSQCNGLAWSPDGALLAVGYTTSPYLIVLDTATWTAIPGIGALPGVACYDTASGGMRFSADGTRLAVIHQNSPTMRVLDTSTWGAITLPAMAGNAQQIAWSPDGARLYVARTSGGLFALDTATWALLSGVPAPGARYAIDVSPDGLLVAVAHNTGGDVYRTDTWARLGSAPSTGLRPYVLKFSPTPSLPAVGGVVMDQAGVPIAGAACALWSRSSTPSRISYMTSAADGAFELYAWSDGRHLRAVFDPRPATPEPLDDDIRTVRPSRATSPDENIYLMPVGADVGIAGNVTTQAAVAADLVVVVLWSNKRPVKYVEPDAVGDWATAVPPGDYGLLYFAAGCQPVCHGPYNVAAP